MKPRWMLWLYPPAWRQRYRAELEALIEDSGSRGGDAFDLFKEAIRMRVLESWSFVQLALVLGIAGLLAGAVTFARLPLTWTSTMEMQLSTAWAIPGAAPSEQPLYERLMAMQNQIFSRTSLTRVIQDPDLDLYPEERKTQPLEDVIERMRRNDIRVLAIRSPKAGVAFKISFKYPDQRKAQQTVQAIAVRFMNANSVTKTTFPLNLDVLDPPSLPRKPSGPNRNMALATGLGTGVLLAGITKLVMRVRGPRAV